METKITSTSGITQLENAVPANFSITDDTVGLNVNLAMAVAVDRKSKAVSFPDYGVAMFPDDMTIGEVKEAMKAAALELDATM